MKNFEDINKSEMYEPIWDDVILEMIKRGHASCAYVQRTLNCGYPKASRSRDEMIKMGYFADETQYFKAKITQKQFEKILANRNKTI